MSNISDNNIKKIINYESKINLNNKINKKIEYFLNDFNKINEKNYVFNLEIIFLKFKSIRTIVRNWESETDINFDIFFEVLQEKTNTLLKVIQTQIDFISSYTQTQFLETREIIKNDFTNLFNMYSV